MVYFVSTMIFPARSRPWKKGPPSPATPSVHVPTKPERSLVIHSNVERTEIGPVRSARRDSDLATEVKCQAGSARVTQIDRTGAVGGHEQRRNAVILVGQRDVRRVDRNHLIVGAGHLILRCLRRTRAGRVRVGAAEHATARDADIGTRPGTGARQDDRAEVEVTDPAEGQ